MSSSPGWQPGEGSRAGLIGSLPLSIPDASGGLCCAGHVGTGLTEHMLCDLAERLAPLHRAGGPVVGAGSPRVQHC